METQTTATVIPFRAAQAPEPAPSESFAGTTLTPPDWVQKKPRVLKHWQEISESLLRHKIINELDRDALAVYCSTFAKFIELDDRLEETGMTQKTTTGYEAETGTFTAWNKLLKPIMAYAKQLGLTPPARVAMRLGDPGQTDIFDEL